MRIWNYIGEFFLFRWLFGKLQKSETDNHETRSCIDEPSLKVESNAIIDYPVKTQSSSFDNLTDVESNIIDDDLEGLDDLDLFLRNKSSNDFDDQSKINR